MKLQLRNISLSFKEKRVLDNISLDVDPGEFLAIIGPSGSGKSTLLHVIGGLLKPDAGKVLLDHEEITGQTGNISYMPQEASLFPWRTVLENALLGQEISIPGKVQKDRAKQLLERANLKQVIDAYPHELSGGMKQRVAFIRALLCPQAVICLDEPFSALDAFTRLEMQKWLLDMWGEYEQSVLFVTHDLDEAIFLADKIVMLSSNPATIKEVIPVPFKRPRKGRLLQDEAFFQFKNKLIKLVESSLLN